MMSCRLYSVARILVLAGTLCVAGASAAPVSSVEHAPALKPTCPAPQPQASEPESFARELRFRKLHLVRPDLIRYPLAYEVYC
jgi:hypothetical protein